MTINPRIKEIEDADPNAKTTAQLGTFNAPTCVCQIHQEPLLFSVFVDAVCWNCRVNESSVLPLAAGGEVQMRWFKMQVVGEGHSMSLSQLLYCTQQCERVDVM